MWDEKEFRTKARKYFERAEKAEPEDGAVLIWCILGLEFMLRAPLAKVSPTLLADPTGASILHALGYKPTDGGDATSIQTKTVLIRLATVAQDFTSDLQRDAKFLVSIRNTEIHSSDSPADELERATWMPKFLRVLSVVAAYFDETPRDYLNQDFLTHAEKLSDEDDKKLEHEVRTRINKHGQFVAGLSEEEKNDRLAAAPPKSGWGMSTKCPACETQVTAIYEVSRFGAESFDSDSDEVVTPVFLVAKELSCPICKLQLDGVREFKIAGLNQDGRSESRDHISDRILEDYDGPDYGND
ncbi:hypothetical protein [Amycolatopsis japonica]|uniref:hypothetical protein n=1 Tax=Amycolatopsis japonica TaxID=208439 RepID=UPI003401DD58